MRSRTWWTWSLPLAVVVLLGALAGGVALRQLYRPAASAQQPPVAEPDGLLRFTPGADVHPARDLVGKLLRTHFTAINERDYAAWESTVTAAKQAEMPPEEWHEEYSSTRDSDVLVHRVESGSDRELRVHLSFTSHQDPGDAPPQLPRSCVRWRVVYPITVDDGPRLATTGLPGSALVGSC
ncbi:hypothetical protein [Bounagaea algeriensis]